jgi:hypothetical protein
MLDQAKLNTLAELIQVQTELRYIREGCDGEVHKPNYQVKIVPGRKYTKIDVGNSGHLMVENETGMIYGIKAYGVIHRGHYYGTLDTISDWSWGEYHPFRRIA